MPGSARVNVTRPSFPERAVGTSEPASLETLEQRHLLAVDLVAAFINAESHTLAPGEDFTAAMVVNNDGDEESPGFFLQMRLSSDGIFGNADARLESATGTSLWVAVGLMLLAALAGFATPSLRDRLREGPPASAGHL